MLIEESQEVFGVCLISSVRPSVCADIYIMTGHYICLTIVHLIITGHDCMKKLVTWR